MEIKELELTTEQKAAQVLGQDVTKTDESLQSDEQGTGSARIESGQSALGAALEAVADAATADDEVLRILAIADGIASGIQTEGINAAHLGQLMWLLRENAVARDMFILKASHVQGVVDLTGVKGFNNIMAHVLWNPALGPKMVAMHAPSSKKGKQSIGAHRITNWIRAFENDQNDKKAKTTTVTDVLAALLYKVECIEAGVDPQTVLRALCTVYDADRVQKWAEKAHEKAIKAGYIPASVEPEGK